MLHVPDVVGFAIGGALLEEVARQLNMLSACHGGKMDTHAGHHTTPSRRWERPSGGFVLFAGQQIVSGSPRVNTGPGEHGPVGRQVATTATRPVRPHGMVVARQHDPCRCQRRGASTTFEGGLLT